MKMVINSIRTLFVLFTLALLTFSCSKKSDPDLRDQYVGTWTETTSNGQPATPPPYVLTLAKGNLSSDVNLTSSNFWINSTQLVVGSVGMLAVDKSINTGSTYTFSDNTKGTIFLRDLSANVSGSQLTVTYTLYAASATRNITLAINAVYTKK